MTDITDSFVDVFPDGWVTNGSLIKVIGVGGGGCNAVTYMHENGVQGCDFIVCNTDSQALLKSSVPNKIQLGKGLGAGCDPVKGRNAALESQEEIARYILTPETQMLFITAGMGGGTGTGASPVIAKMAKEKGILTVAVVTLPFKNEGNESLSKAIDGIRELEKNVDSLLIINNEKLYTYFGSLLIQEAFPKADEVLATAVRGITEIINKPGYINVDFEDVKTMMKNSGMALMGCGKASGKNRLKDAVKQALESPLLNDFDLKTARNVLINITAGRNEQGLTMDGLNEINTLINQYTGNANKFKRGIVWDDSEDFGDSVQITAIATGFNVSKIDAITDVSLGNLIIVDKDFEYHKETQVCTETNQFYENGGVISKIGFTTKENKRTFNYTTKPTLVTLSGENIAELEGTAAIRRIAAGCVETKE